MRIGITGTSSDMTPAQRAALEAILRELGATELHHGDCVGADADAHAVAVGLGITVVVHPPEDARKRAYCQATRVEPPKPYLDRNRAIVDATTVLVATPWEQTGEHLRSGAWATVRYARRRGRRVVIVRPDGARQDSGPA